MASATHIARTEGSEETRELGRALGELLAAGDVVALEGDLGAGKTVFAQGAALGLGFDGYVSSPTFVIVNEYAGRLPIYHVDLYRVSSEDELVDLGYREMFYGDGVALVEWADRVPGLLPDERIDIAMRITGETSREIEITGRGERLGGLVAGLGAKRD